MRKVLLLLIALFISIIGYAYDAEVDGIYYNLIPKGKVAVVTFNENGNPYSGSVTIPKTFTYEGVEYSVTSIGPHAFESCTGLKSVVIQNSVTSIEYCAFNSCWSLKSVTIPNSVTYIAPSAFVGCSALTSVTIPNSVTSIGDYAFEGCIGLTSVIIPNSVASIGTRAFQNCSALTSVTIPNSVTSIIDYTFYGCRALTSVTIPNSVTSIGSCSFWGCSNLTSVTIPNSVTNIGSSAFYGCSNLTSVSIPNSVTNIGIFSFYGCTSLTSVSIPNSVTSIGSCTFYGCSSLSSVTIPNSVTRIEDTAFEGCSGLTTMTIPNSVTSIGIGAFENCSGLTSVTIPNSVTNIEGGVFRGCSKLEEVYCYAEKVPNTSTDAFENSYPEYTTLYVPAESLSAYKTTTPWNSFGTFRTISGSGIEPPKCAKPDIIYGNKQLTFTCSTEDVEYVSEIRVSDGKKYYDRSITLDATYEINVYATKAGYDNSDIVTATLCWIEAEPSNVGITTGINEIPSHAVLIQNNGGILSINGAIEGKIISVYNLSGQLLGSATATSETTTINTSLSAGETCIVKIGDKSVKIMLR